MERKERESFLSFRERKLSFLSWKKKNFLHFSFFFLGKERYLSFSSKAQKIFPFFAFFLSVWKNLSFLSFPKWESYLSFPRESFLSCPPLAGTLSQAWDIKNSITCKLKATGLWANPNGANPNDRGNPNDFLRKSFKQCGLESQLGIIQKISR